MTRAPRSVGLVNARVLIVDEERELAEAVAQARAREGYEVATVASGVEAMRLARQARPHLILLDPALQDLSGNEVCRRLDADPDTAWIPVVIVSSRDAEIDRVVGFELGAADYVVKPFSLRELVLRCRAILRRAEPPAPSDRLEVGPLALDASRFRVAVEGDEVSLTALELRLLATLMQAKGRVLSRDDLLDVVWGGEADVMLRTVDVHIMRLRDKLGPASALIETVRGVGYRIR